VRRSVRRLLRHLALGTLLLAGCADDGSDADAGGSSTATTAPTSTTVPVTTTTEARPVDSTFVAEDVDALCADLEGLADIDPDADPTQAAVDRLVAIAEVAPTGVAEPLQEVAAFGQAVVDGDVEAALQSAAIEAATILIAYGNEACQIDVPLFDAIAGV
jgi:hypothetical protein